MVRSKFGTWGSSGWIILYLCWWLIRILLLHIHLATFRIILESEAIKVFSWKKKSKKFFLSYVIKMEKSSWSLCLCRHREHLRQCVDNDTYTRASTTTVFSHIWKLMSPFFNTKYIERPVAARLMPTDPWRGEGKTEVKKRRERSNWVIWHLTKKPFTWE